MLGIICAMDIEAKGLIDRMVGAQRICSLGYVFTRGSIGEKELVVVKSGIGKCNAAAVTALLIEKFGVSEVVNLGVCGGRSAGTLIVASAIVQYDFDTTAFGDKLGQLDGFDSPFIRCSEALSDKFIGERGVIASGDRFIAEKKDADFLARTFGAIGFDMESGAVAQICTLAGVPFAVLRVVSDCGDQDEYEKFKIDAASKGISAILSYLIKE